MYRFSETTVLVLQNLIIVNLTNDSYLLLLQTPEMKDIRYGAVDPEIMLTLNAPKIIVERANDDDSVCCK